MAVQAKSVPVGRRASEPRYVELVRVSSKGQADRDTPELQRKALDRLRESRPGVFVERIDPEGGLSGALPIQKRSDLQRLLELTVAHAYDEVRVYAVDRLTRSDDPRERMAIFGMLQDAKAILVDTSNRVIDPSDESGIGELDFFLQTFFAAKERKRFRQRTTDGKKRVAARGAFSHGGLPWGLHWDKERVEWSLDSEAAAIIRQIYLWADGGLSIREIADRLNAEGIESARGKKWISCTVAGVLHNTAYRGEYIQTIDGERFPCSVPHAVDSELWHRVQEVLDHRRQRPSRPAGSTKALCRGLGICGVCGLSLNVTQKGGGFVYYQCATRHSTSARPPCGNLRHSVKRVDGAVWGAIEAKLRDPALLTEACAGGEQKDSKSWQTQIEKCDERLKKLERQQREVLQHRSKDRITEEVATEQLEQIAREHRNLQKTKEAAEKAIREAAVLAKHRGTLVERVNALRGALDHTDFESRRKFVEAVVPNLPGFGITVHVDGHIEIRGALDVDDHGSGADLAHPSAHRTE